ncbi:MAG: tRNA 2-thiouridine(34) synthase MnmA [Candidatus Omnitrophota bacterium]|jgi:tRNA-specific 2-thiouridylase
MKKRVFVAMSGGVDSSVAAALLQKKGFETIGITMCFNVAETGGKKPGCCGLSGIEDARRVAHLLGIKHYVLNLQKVFQKEVIDNFRGEYLAGFTPNPCVRCNQFIKFGSLLRKARALGADFLATGHYAKIAKGKSGWLLKKARDLRKDQSYFLYRLGQDELKYTLLPLGGYYKEEVRRLAGALGLPVAQKPDSQEVCFLPGNDYRDFLKSSSKGSFKPGAIVDRQGKLLGRHQGAAFYTIGQRQGLGIAAKHPLYVTGIRQKENLVVVGPRQEAYALDCLLNSVHFTTGQPFKKKVEIKVRIRYNHKEAKADIYPVKDKFRVIFHKPQFAITPGQSAVFYLRGTVLGGGIIERIF